MPPLLAVATLAVAVLAVLAGLPVGAAPPAPPRPEQAGPTRLRAEAPAQRRPDAARPNADRLRGPRLPSSPPVAITIPEIGISAPLVRLGLEADGTLEPPRSASAIGWFTGSAAPGAIGPAVIAGHVRWGSTPGPFRDLARLAPGDRVAVQRADGTTARFAVTRVRQFDKARFPTSAVYGVTDHAALRLITCGGRFAPTTGRFPDNVVVFARLVAPAR